MKPTEKQGAVNRRTFLLATAALAATSAAGAPSIAFAQAAPAPQIAAPSAARIEEELRKPPKKRIRPKDRVDIDVFVRRPDLRDYAPHIDIQAINFEFGSARIPRSEWWKVREIAIALSHMLRRDPFELFLIEGHTDAVGSRYSNQILSERRASELRQVLVRQFGVPPRALETIGYGEDYLLVPTPYENWRNRRVTIRRVTDFVLRR